MKTGGGGKETQIKSGKTEDSGSMGERKVLPGASENHRDRPTTTTTTASSFRRYRAARFTPRGEALRYEYAFRNANGARGGKKKRERTPHARSHSAVNLVPRDRVVDRLSRPGARGSIRRRLKRRRQTTFENRETDSQSIRNAVAIRCQSRRPGITVIYLARKDVTRDNAGRRGNLVSFE